MPSDDLLVSSSRGSARARFERVGLDAAAIRYLLDVGARCARADNDVPACLEAIIEAAIAITAADKGHVQIFDRESGTLAIAAQRGFEEPFLKFFANVRSGHAAACGAAMSATKRIIVEDVTDSDIFRGEPALDVLISAGVRAVQSTPLVSSRGEIVGVMSTHFKEPHRPDERDLGFVDLLARHAADRIERKQVENALRESEAKYRSLFDNMADGFAVCAVVRDDAGRVVDMTYRELNQAVERQTGVNREAFIGRRLSETSTKDEFERWMPLHRRVADTGEPVTGETYSESTGRWFEFTIYQSGRDENSILVRDTSERKRANTALRESEADLAKELDDARVLQEISNELVSEGGPNGYYNHIVEVARTLMRSDAASIQELDAADSRLKLLAHTGFHAESAACWAYVDAGVGSSCGRALTAHQRVVVPDMDKFEADPHDVAAYRKSGIMSVQSTPLVATSGRIVGMMSTHWNHPHTPSAESYRFFDILARLAADFMERARTKTALRESEEKYRTLFETMGQGYSLNEVVRDAEGAAIDLRYLELNPAFERLTGASLSEARGRLASEVFPGLDRYWVDICDRAVRTGVIERVEHELTPNGHWYQSNFYPIGRDRVLSLYDDISERKRAEAATRAREERQALLLRVSDALRPLADAAEIEQTTCRLLGQHLDVDRAYYVDIDETAGVATVSRQYLREGALSSIGVHPLAAFGWSIPPMRRGEIVVVNDIHRSDLVPEADAAAMEAVQQAAIIGAPVVRGDTLVAVLCVTETVPRTWKSAEVELVREILERTWAALERARAETALRASEERLKEADRRKDEFLATLAHELRNPLAPIRTGLELIRIAGNTPAAVERVRSLMDRQVGHMVRLIDDLLDVSRITRGKISLQREPTLLNSLVTSAVDAERAAIAAKRLTLNVELPGATCVVDVDPTRFVQVIANLLDNAVKFTHAGGTISIRGHVNGEDGTAERELILSVSDSGDGIAPEFLPRVFDLFAQGNSGSSPAGLGIGLALARRLIEMQGGTIEVRSEGRGLGTEFVIRMPLSSELPKARSEASADARVDCRVLVIDDNRDAADALAMLIEEIGGNCTRAYDGESGLRELLHYRPDAVLLDIAMPGLDGYETCRRIRQQLGDDVTLVAVTGFGQQHDKEEARRAGFDEHLTKPADPAVLQRLLVHGRSTTG